MRRKPEIIIVAGPNGAGKTSFVNEYLPAAENNLAYVNADEIARDLRSAGHEESVDFAAARRMLLEIDELTRSGAEFMIETTLSSRMYARLIPSLASPRLHGRAHLFAP